MPIPQPEVNCDKRCGWVGSEGWLFAFAVIEYVRSALFLFFRQPLDDIFARLNINLGSDHQQRRRPPSPPEVGNPIRRSSKYRQALYSIQQSL